MMNPLLPLAAMSALALLQACSTPPPAGDRTDGVSLTREEAAIPFFNSQRAAVTGWQADGVEGLWVEGARNEWYYAKLNSPCIGLDNALRLGFDTGVSDRLDRFSRILVPNEPGGCTITSFTRSDPPPDRRRRNVPTDETN